MSALLLSSSAVATDRCVQIQELKRGTQVKLVATLSGCLEATITITAQLENMSSSEPLPLTVDTAGRTELSLTTFAAIDPHRPWHYQWHDDWKPGRRASGTPAAVLYTLPYRDGPHEVRQGPNGSFSHGPGSQDEDAIDFAMPVGTPVYPARAGVVVAVRQDCTEGGPDLRFKHDVNYVIVRHDDGTFAEYLHLAPGGVRVKLGERVTPDRSIALSGNTGYSSEPHLHFAVFNTIDGKTRATRPVQFQSASGALLTIEEGRRY